jgi:septal ring factor EnvC (AmiA/AmiB activator)
MGLEELNQFGRLEEKIESLIAMVGSLNKEKAKLERALHGQQQEINSLTKEIETLDIDRDMIRKRIADLLKKIQKFT